MNIRHCIRTLSLAALLTAVALPATAGTTFLVLSGNGGPWQDQPIQLASSVDTSIVMDMLGGSTRLNFDNREELRRLLEEVKQPTTGTQNGEVPSTAPGTSS